MTDPREELRLARDRVLKECAAEVQAVLDKHGCVFKTVPFIDAEGRVRANLELAVK